MGTRAKVFGLSVGGFVFLVALVFLLGGVSLGYKMIFKPAHENVEREVYENTQSFVHGKVQDLAKYKREYDACTNPNDQAAIRAIINQQFAQFDSAKVADRNLRNFLIQMRGF